MLYNSALVFAAHPDDEIVMAGTIGRLVAEGTRVTVVQMTDGCEGYPELEMRHAIVEMRLREAAACDNVLGIAKRHHLDRPDMGLVNDKPTLHEVIRIIRAERPDAAFIQGDATLHRDHRATFHLAVEGLWHAGGPVAVALGRPWITPEIYLYKDASTTLQPFGVHIEGYGRKFYQALATQESQFALFAEHFGLESREQFAREMERLIREAQRTTEYFWVARDVLGYTELPPREAHRLTKWAAPTEA